VSETGPIPTAATCYDCRAPVIWLWSPRVEKTGGWVKFERASEDGMTIRSHRCCEPRGEFSYTGGESAP
jgi:hypothetical protein